MSLIVSTLPTDELETVDRVRRSEFRPAGRARWPQVVIAALVMASAWTATAAASDVASPARAPAPPPAAYAIGFGDVLRITVWKEPDLTGDVTVRLDGNITLPLIGDVVAIGRPPRELASLLATQLQRYIESPRVTVSVIQATSARFYVVGQMMRPGEFPLAGRMTVLKALALAGGFREFARPESIVIVREDQTVLPFNYKWVTDGKALHQNVFLAPGDTIVVP